MVMSQKYVGIDLGAYRVKMVVVTSSFRGVQVVETHEETLGVVVGKDGAEAVDPLSHRISVALSMLRSHNLLGQSVSLALPPGLLSYRLLDFPFADERRIAQTVMFEAEGQFPVPLEQLVYGHLLVPVSSGGRALVVAANRDKVEQISGLFRRAGCEVKVTTAPAMAAAQVVSPELEPIAADAATKPGALLLDLGHRFTHVIGLGAKGPLAVRTLRRGGRNITQAIATQYQLDVASAEQAKHTDAFLAHHGVGQIDGAQLEASRLVARELEPILRDLEHTRQWLSGSQQIEVNQILLCGGGAELRGLPEYLQEQTGLSVVRAVPKAQGLRLPAEGRSWTESLVALGAAYGAARRPLVQLHGDVPGAIQSGWMQERMSSLVAIGVAVMAFGALDTIAKVRAAEAELQAHQDQLEEVSKKVLGEALSPEAVEEKLALAEGTDLTSLIPERSALEVLEMLTKIATPSDLAEAKQKAAEAEVAATLPMAGQMLPDDEEGLEGSEAAVEAVIGPIDPNAGVVAADELVISEVQINEKKIELHASANTSSVQDRMFAKLGQLGCMTNPLKGKVKGNERKSFEMNIEHTCYRKPKGDDEKAAE